VLDDDNYDDDDTDAVSLHDYIALHYKGRGGLTSKNTLADVELLEPKVWPQPEASGVIAMPLRR
jgi:hypothetical protein